MAEKLFRILNVMHDALDFSGRGHVAPSSLSHDDFKACPTIGLRCALTGRAH